MHSEKHKCQHAPCKCIVDAEDAYCSPQCERRADNGSDAPCGCIHRECETSIGIGVSESADASN